MNNFKKYFLQIPSDRRCFHKYSTEYNHTVKHCIFGVPLISSYGWITLKELPRHIKGFHFLMGSSCEKLIKAFSNSCYPENIEHLGIGDSSEGLLDNGLEYSKLVEILSNTHFPNLKCLELGVWELFCNSHCLYGHLGNITYILNNSPNLEKLCLYGSFKLDESISLSKLINLTIVLDDEVTGVNGGNIKNESMTLLLSSHFPSLKTINLDLKCDDDINEFENILPNEFLSGLNFPNLKVLEISGKFVKGQKQELINNLLKHKPNLKIFTKYMVEP